MIAGAALGGLFLAAVLLVMNLGHWYLVSRSLPFRLLARGAALFAVARRRPHAAPGDPRWHSTGGDGLSPLLSLERDALFFLFRVMWGIVGPLALSYFIWKTADMRSNQAATGLLYVALVFVSDRRAALLLPDGRDRLSGLRRRGASLLARHYCPDCLTSRDFTGSETGNLRVREVREAVLRRLRGVRGAGRRGALRFLREPGVLPPEGLRSAPRLFVHGDFARPSRCLRRLEIRVDLVHARCCSRPSSSIGSSATRVRAVTICYRCDAEYRDVAPNPRHRGYDPHVAERDAEVKTVRRMR